MKRIVILGSSAAGVKVIEAVRRNDPLSEITIISFDGHYPYKRDAFPLFIANEISPKDVFCRAKDFYERHNVKIVFDQKISHINFKRKKIFTEDKQQFDYDILLVTDTPENRYPDIKGVGKECVYGYKKLKDIDQIVNALPIAKTVLVQSNSFSGLFAALSFAKREKEVILVVPADNFLTTHFEAETVEWLTGKFEEKRLRILQGNAITEILGDRDAKAVRLQSGKVFSAEIILFAETDEDLRLFADSSIKADRKIEVNAEFKADADGVFAVDQACSASGPDPVTPLPVLDEQGEMVAAVMNGQERAFAMPVCAWSQNIEGLDITVLGDIDTGRGTVSRKFNQEAGTYKGLYIKDNCLAGAVLINKNDERDEILDHIRKKAVIDPAAEEKATDPNGGDECYIGGAGDENISTELIDN